MFNLLTKSDLHVSVNHGYACMLITEQIDVQLHEIMGPYIVAINHFFEMFKLQIINNVLSATDS